METYNLGKRLREARELNGLSLGQAAYTLGISYTSIRSYESNKICPSVPRFKAMARLYKVSSDYLLGLSGSESISLDDVPLGRRQFVEDIVSIVKQSIHEDCKERKL